MATVNDKMTAIADAIREKTGDTEPLTLDGMAESIPEVYEAGKGAMWDSIQNYGNRIYYDAGFAYWSIEHLSPDYKVVPKGHCLNLFLSCKQLKTIDKDKFDLSQANYGDNDSSSATSQTCSLCTNLEVFPDIGLQAGYYYATWNGCTEMHTIEKIRVNENCVFSTDAFGECRKLQHILDIEGLFGQNVNFAQCSSLTPATMKRIIKHLKDFYGSVTEITTTLYVNKTAWDALEAEGFNDEDKAWYENWLGEPLPNGYSWYFAMVDLCWGLVVQ